MTKQEIESAFACQISDFAWQCMSDQQRRETERQAGERWYRVIGSRLSDAAWVTQLSGLPQIAAAASRINAAAAMLPGSGSWLNGGSEPNSR